MQRGACRVMNVPTWHSDSRLILRDALELPALLVCNELTPLRGMVNGVPRWGIVYAASRGW